VVKWKRDPFTVDAVRCTPSAARKRSSYYSDYTFGVWTKGEDGDVLVPVGKAYFGFTDEELAEIDRFVRRHTVERFGPVREVVHERHQGLVLEVAFEGLQRSTRHKSGLAMLSTHQPAAGTTAGEATAGTSGAARHTGASPVPDRRT
jgi:DNA ligase-1